jgi:hypothetical protein
MPLSRTVIHSTAAQSALSNASRATPLTSRSPRSVPSARPASPRTSACHALCTTTIRTAQSFTATVVVCAVLAPALTTSTAPHAAPASRPLPTRNTGAQWLCKMDMHESVRPVTIMRCGHAMHVGCFEKHAATSFACPKCRRSMGDMKPYWDVLDRLLETELASVTDLVSITCRDCGRDSEATIHPQYHKCDHAKCGSYNTISREFPSGGVASSAGQQKDP